MVKILIAEDEALTLEFLEYILRQEGFEPVLAPDGDAAFRLAKEHVPDLILLDVMMPYIDGFEVLRRLKESKELRDIPVIMLTARTSDSDTHVGFEMGAEDYVEKPYSINKLLSRIRRVLRTEGKLDDMPPR